MSEMFVEPNCIVECKCGAKLKIYNVWYEDWGKVKRIDVEEHKCLQYSPAYNDWCEEYYAYEGDMDDKTQTVCSNTILCSVYLVALVRCAVRTYR